MIIFTPQNDLALLGIVSLIISAILIVFSQVRKNDLEVLRSSNKDLRDAIKDKGDEINTLIAKVDLLEKKVAILETKNNDLSILVKEALIMYFTRNPKVADKIQNEN